MKNQKLKFWILVCGFTFYILNFRFYLFAQNSDKLVSLSKQIIEAKTSEELYAPFAELKDLYFNDNRYTEFTEFLNSLSQKKKTLEPFTNYYIALSRYQQLKYLEDTQKWDEYFTQGNIYRDQLTATAQKALDATTPQDAIHIYARLLLWQFHKDQQDAFVENVLSDLMSSVLEYSKAPGDTKPIKEVADKLLSYVEKGKSKQLYSIYAQKLATSDIKDDALGMIALGFYKQGNLELAESIYNLYIDRIIKSVPLEKLISILIDIAKQFSYQDRWHNDPVYAQEIFNKIEELGGKKFFDQELMYLRAFNLEKAKEYPKAKDAYNDLVTAFPETKYNPEAVFKVGIINTYVLRDKNEGKSFFEKLAHSTSSLDSARDYPERVKRVEGALSANPERLKGIEGLAQKEILNAHVFASLYHLGLLSQWEDDFAGAKDYYNKLINLAGESFQEIVELAKERLKEIEQVKPIEYNLKTFLDVSLKDEYAMFDMTKLDLRSHPYNAEKEESINISATTYTPTSGCLQIELQYLWSGDLGTEKPSPTQSTFDTTYIHTGTKVINLVVISPAGIIDRDIDMVDVH